MPCWRAWAVPRAPVEPFSGSLEPRRHNARSHDNQRVAESRPALARDAVDPASVLHSDAVEGLSGRAAHAALTPSRTADLDRRSRGVPVFEAAGRCNPARTRPITQIVVPDSRIASNGANRVAARTDTGPGVRASAGAGAHERADRPALAI